MELQLPTRLRFPERAPTSKSSPAPNPPVLSTAELAECTCPEFCERDHGNE
jgi:hypothetical protein